MRCLALIIFFLIGYETKAQFVLPDVDRSPMDMSYYPDGYPVLKIQDKTKEPPVARVIYSRPQKSGRVIFGDLIEYGKVWRLGANEATEIEFFRNVKINNVPVKKGRYTIYAIPYPDKWTMIINKETDLWGSFRYEIKKDIARIDVPTVKRTPFTESFAMAFEKTADGFALLVSWDDIIVNMPIVFNN
jgi:hypothetical protein